MTRFTRKIDGQFIVRDGNMSAAIQRLGQFEDAYEALMTEQEQIPVILEELRANGKEKTVRYRETMARKLVNRTIMMFFEEHGL